VRPGWAGTLLRRYTAADLAVLTPEEAGRFVAAGGGDPQTDSALAWELLYRLEPELYDRMATAERLHPGVIHWLPRTSDTIVEVAAGTGRLTLHLLDRAHEIVAIEPVAPFREILRRKLAAAAHGDRARVTHGFFDDLPVASGFADLVVACSAVTPASGHGGDAGLAEMERLCRPGGCVAIVWPNNIDWLTAHHYQYASFAGPMTVDFASYHEAVQLAEIFYPQAIGEVRRRGSSRVPYEVLGVNPPCDVAFKVVT
jgi:ubiquinone/menaquinone biosynthesis C-methylase UbiE